MANTILFIENFIRELGDVKDWNHNGVVVELPRASGTCVCGHPIKFEYYIINSKTKEKRTLGSECINHFKDYNLELYESLISSKKEFEENKKEERKTKKYKLEQAEFNKVYQELSTTHKAVKELCEDIKGWIDNRNLYYYGRQVDSFNYDKYKTFKTKIRKAIEDREVMQNILKEYNETEEHLLTKAKERVLVESKISALFQQSDNFRRAYKVNEYKIKTLEERKNFIEQFEKGLIKVEKVYRLQILGKTYQIKDSLKEQGFRWNGSAWEQVVNEDFVLIIPEKYKSKIEIWKDEM